MNHNEYITMKDLGHAFGMTSHQIGKALKEIGLRTEEGKPSRAAFKGNYCDQKWTESYDNYIWVWHAEKTAKLLELNGCEHMSDVKSEEA